MRAVGANVDHVRKELAVIRASAVILVPGAWVGGSCFPKDAQALVRTAQESKSPLGVLEAVERANDRQKRRLYDSWLQRSVATCADVASLSGPRVQAQHRRYARGTGARLIEQLLNDGATVAAHDPAAIAEARRRLASQSPLQRRTTTPWTVPTRSSSSLIGTRTATRTSSASVRYSNAR